ncbi:chitinase [Arthrobacter alpinus]|uniref:Chitinase n=1 Tax=Arthrobacter alpinus TaxID=656366 RepID=A0A1H5KKS6_9MICC|nr:chitinase [Arthrobacter alpinus]
MTSGKHLRGPSLAPNVRRIVAVISFLLIAVLVVAGIFVWRNRAIETKPWFGGYVDVTLAPALAFETPTSKHTKNVLLSFIVADPANPCVPHWGTHYSLDQAGTSLDLDAKIEKLRENGGHAAISFGGAASTELATSCTDLPTLQNAYQSVIERYEVSTVDFDIEGENLLDSVAGERRAQAVAQVQKDRADRGKPLDVWLTLPVSPRGLTDDGVAEIEQMLSKGVDLAGVNIMTMNYGASRVQGQSMLEASEAAAVAAHSQVGIIYQRAGFALDDAAAWAKIGLTPMIGINEITTDVFDVQDAIQFAEFARSKNVGRMSQWSNNRDTQCTTESLNPAIAPHTCSGVSQDNGDFSNILGEPFTGRFR